MTYFHKVPTQKEKEYGEKVSINKEVYSTLQWAFIMYSVTTIY